MGASRSRSDRPLRPSFLSAGPIEPASTRHIIRRRRRRAELNPNILIRLRLTLDIAVWSLAPQPHVVRQIVENEIAAACLDGQDRMALVIGILDHSHKQRLARKSLSNQHLALH